MVIPADAIGGFLNVLPRQYVFAVGSAFQS